MKSKTKKIIVAVLALVIGLPMALMLAAFACFAILDKTNGTVVSSGLTRRYLLYVPKTYDRSKPTPLVISLHPAATWPAVQQSISRWNDLADQQGFLVVYPAGTGAFFGGLGPGPQVFPMGPQSSRRDVRFLSDLLDSLQAQYNIDPKRIYADGMSNGAGMAFLLSCKLPNRIAAVGLVSGAFPGSWELCGDREPVPTVLFHGTADKLAPYQGGTSSIAPGPFPDIPEWTTHLAQRNNCPENPSDARITPHVRRLTYANCARDADVVSYTIEGGGHTWPGSKPLAEWWSGPTTQEIDATDIMWDFFLHHARVPK